MTGKKIDLFGCQVDALTMGETIDLVEEVIREGIPRQHVVVNVAKIVSMQKDSELKRIIKACDIVNVDGMPIVWASKLLNVPLPCRVAGVDLFQELVGVSAQKGYRPFFFGAKEEVVKQVVETFKSRHPGLQVAGYRNGYFKKDEECDIAEMIKDSKADMLFVGFPSPMKEKFLNKWMPTMKTPFCMGVGGSFDIVAGKTKRAPAMMQNYGLEWLYRIYQEPKRMWLRYAKTNPVFILMVLRALVKN